MYAQIGFADALRRIFPTALARHFQFRGWHPLGNSVRPKFSNIWFEAMRLLSWVWVQPLGHPSWHHILLSLSGDQQRLARAAYNA